MKTFYVYIMASARRTLYVGITSHLRQRVHQHQQHLVPGFTTRYRVTHLVYYEMIRDAYSAIAREKQIKRWRRAEKIELIESLNPNWHDLADAL